MANTPNEAIASIKDREDAVSTIKSLYGLFDSPTGENFFIHTLKDHEGEILEWLPNHILIELAKKHMAKEWEGYPWHY